MCPFECLTVAVGCVFGFFPRPCHWCGFVFDVFQGGFEDAHSGIASYRVTVIDSTGTKLVDNEDVGTATTFSKLSLSLSDGDVYTLSVVAVNGVGAVSAAVTTVHTVDASAPVPNQAWDGDTSGSDVDFQQPGAVGATWDAFAEPDSALSYAVDVCERVQVPEQCMRVADATTATSFSSAGLPLSVGVSYFVRITGTNGAGLSATVETDGFVLDNAAPVSGVVRDGISQVDVDVQGSWTFSANWDHWTSVFSPMVSYEWCLGTTPGAEDVMPWTATSGLRVWASASFDDTTSVHPGAMVFASVRGTTAAGLSSVSSSDGVLVDLTPPVMGNVYHGSRAAPLNLNTTSCSHVVEATWDAADDLETGVVSYTVSVGTQPGLANIAGPFPADDVAVAVATGSADARPSVRLELALPIPDGTWYYVTIDAANGAGLVSHASSVGMLVDASPPLFVTLDDRPPWALAATAASWFSSSTRNATAWVLFTDAQSGVARYEHRLCRASQLGEGQDDDGVVVCTDAPPCTDAGVVCDITHPQAGAGDAAVELHFSGQHTLRHATMYAVQVWAVNEAGVAAHAESTGWTIDMTPPVLVAGGDVVNAAAAQDSWATISASWDGLFVDPESTIAGYEVCVGATQGTDDVVPCHSVGTAVSVTLTVDSQRQAELTAAHTPEFYVTVRAINGAGGRSSATGSAVNVDVTPPLAGAVFDGLSGRDTTFSVSPVSLSVTWQGFRDPNSTLVDMLVAFGSTPGASDVAGPLSAGLATSFSAQELSLVHGQTYYATVTAVNAAGGQVSNTSNGVIVALRGPSTTGALVAVAGVPLGSDAPAYHTDTTSLSASWTAFSAEPALPVVAYEVAVCRVDMLCDTGAFSDVGLDTSVAYSTLQLLDGVSYRVHVRARNNAGVWSDEVVSGTFMVDTTPPSVVGVFNGAHRVHMPWLPALDQPIPVSWSGVVDRESGLAALAFALGSAPGLDDVQVWTTVDIAATDATIPAGQLAALNQAGPPLYPESVNTTLVYFALQATDHAGFQTLRVSSAVKVDLTPPVFPDAFVADAPEGPDVEEVPESGRDAETGAVFTSVWHRYDASWLEASDAQSEVTYRVSLRGPGLPYSPRFGNGYGGGVMVGTNQAYSWHGLVLEQGGWYRVYVDAINEASLTTSATSAGVIVDRTPPFGGFVIDGIGFGADDDRDYRDVDLLSLEASWGGWQDDVSGIARYEWAVAFAATNDTAAQVQVLLDWTDVGRNTSAYLDGSVLTPGARYHVLLRVYNGAGLFAQVQSDGVVVDAAQPCVSDVVHGPVAQRASPWDGLTSPDTIEASWHGVVDPAVNSSAQAKCANRTADAGMEATLGSPLHGFDWQLERMTPVNSTNVTFGLGINASVVNATINGTSEVETINVRNVTGNATANPELNVDPVVGFAHVIMPFEQTGPRFASPLSACCSSFPEHSAPQVAPDRVWKPMSTADGFGGGAVALIRGGEVLVSATQYGFVMFSTKDSMAVVGPGVVNMTARAVDDLGVDIVAHDVPLLQRLSASASSSADGDAVVLALASPAQGVLFRTRDSFHGDILLETATVDWSATNPARDGVAVAITRRLLATVGSSDGMLHLYSLSRSTSASLATSVALPNDVNPRGATIAMVDETIVVGAADSSSPGHGVVLVYSVAFRPYVVSLTWRASTGSIPYLGAVPVALSPGATYVAAGDAGFNNDAGRVFVFDNADAAAAAATTQPPAPFCTLGAPTDASLAAFGTSLAFGVPGSTPSPMLAITSPGSDEVVVARVNHTLLAGALSSEPCAVVGSVSADHIAVHTGGIAFDSQAVAFGMAVTPRAGASAGASGGVVPAVATSAVCAPGFVRADSGRGTMAPECVACPTGQPSWGGVAAAQCEDCDGRECPDADTIETGLFSGLRDGLDLENGARYRITVQATARSGRQSTAASNEFVVDWTPPDVGLVMDGTGQVNTTECAYCKQEVDYTANTTHVSATWCCGWQDLESGLSSYMWSAGTSPGAADIVPWTDVGLAEGGHAAGLSLQHGWNVTTCVRVTNMVGLQSPMVCSDGMIVDTTPPEVTSVLDGFNPDFDIDQQSFTNAMFANFEAEDDESGVFECVVSVVASLCAFCCRFFFSRSDLSCLRCVPVAPNCLQV